MNHLSATIEFSGALDQRLKRLKYLVSQEGYKLKRICTDEITSDILDELCKKHPTLEELRLPELVLNWKDLPNITDHLKALTILHIKVKKDDHQKISFLDHLPNLKHLKMASDGPSGSSGGYNWLNFDQNVNHLGLEVLELTKMAQSNPSPYMYNWFKFFPHLTTIKLEDCVLNHWSDFLAQLSCLKKLECLVLDDVTERNGTCDNNRAGSSTLNIKVLKIRGGEMSNTSQLVTLLNGSPNMETIYLLNILTIENSLLEALHQKAQRSAFYLNEMPIDSTSSFDCIKQAIDVWNLKDQEFIRSRLQATPAFTATDFPPLPSAVPVVEPKDHPRPAGSYHRDTAPRAGANPEEEQLYSSSELWSIYMEFSDRFKQCKTRSDQGKVVAYLLGKFEVD